MKHAKAVRRIIFTVLIVAAVIVGFNTYTADYYHAKDYELQTTEVSETDAYIAYGDPQSEMGLIFYPGAKVEETAYAPVIDGLVQQGIFCVMVKMPAHLAILKPNAADEVRQEFGEVKHWYLAGHSLGGAMAGSYAAKHESELAGLIFLAAYPTRELQTLPVLSLYGSEDGVLNMEKYQEAIGLAADCREYVLEGGNHAGFGNYGSQKGDGEAGITDREQWQETIDYIMDMIRQQQGEK